jgi:hypothetical protein
MYHTIPQILYLNGVIHIPQQQYSLSDKTSNVICIVTSRQDYGDYRNDVNEFQLDTPTILWVYLNIRVILKNLLRGAKLIGNDVTDGQLEMIGTRPCSRCE